MTDNVTLPGTGTKVAADEATYSGETATVQLVRVVGTSGSEGSKTVIEDPVVTLLTAQAAYLDGLEGYVDGLETLIGSTNTKLDTLIAGVNVQSPGDVISLTPTLDTSAYAAGDTLFATTAISSAVRANDQRAILQSLVVVDKDDQKPAFKLYFFSSNVTFGTANAAPSISDSDAASFLGSVAISAADYDDLGGVSVACYKGIGLMLESVSGGTTIYVAATTSSTPTHTASGLVLRFGFLWT